MHQNSQNFDSNIHFRPSGLFGGALGAQNGPVMRLGGAPSQILTLTHYHTTLLLIKIILHKISTWAVHALLEPWQISPQSCSCWQRLQAWLSIGKLETGYKLGTLDQHWALKMKWLKFMKTYEQNINLFDVFTLANEFLKRVSFQ